jgi:hypothetical protein
LLEIRVQMSIAMLYGNMSEREAAAHCARHFRLSAAGGGWERVSAETWRKEYRRAVALGDQIFEPGKTWDAFWTGIQAMGAPDDSGDGEADDTPRF